MTFNIELIKQSILEIQKLSDYLNEYFLPHHVTYYGDYYNYRIIPEKVQVSEDTIYIEYQATPNLSGLGLYNKTNIPLSIINDTELLKRFAIEDKENKEKQRQIKSENMQKLKNFANELKLDVNIMENFFSRYY